MSDYQYLDLRAPGRRRADGMSARGILLTLAVVIVLFLLLAALGTGSREGDPTVPAAGSEQAAPSVAQSSGE